MKSAAENVVPVTAELGGKNPAIVFPDANLEKAADDLTKAFWLAGQVCFAPTKIFIHDDVYDEFQRALIERAEGLTVGPGEEDPDVGPVISANAVDRIEEYVSEAAKSGATVHTGGEQIQGSGHFFAPTLIDGVSDDAPISCEEVFGPVVATYRFENETEAVKRANNTKYGLYGVVWTDNLARAHRVAGDLEAGSIAVNEYPATFPQAPFGGYKKSGIGREKGQQAVEHFTQIKNVTISLE
jgi:aldehyde dehydrogenase (NAD+)